MGPTAEMEAVERKNSLPLSGFNPEHTQAQFCLEIALTKTRTSSRLLAASFRILVLEQDVQLSAGHTSHCRLFDMTSVP